MHRYLALGNVCFKKRIAQYIISVWVFYQEIWYFLLLYKFIDIYDQEINVLDEDDFN